MPRPRVCITLFVWAVACCGLLVIWQAPPPPPASSSSSSSSLDSQDYFLPRSYNKPAAVPRTHVSNLRYLQRKDKLEIESPLSLPSNTMLQHRLTDERDAKPTSYATSSNFKFYPYPRVKAYPKISFRNHILPKMFVGSSATGYEVSKDAVLPINDLITSHHRSRVRDATPTNSVISLPSTREEKRLIELPTYKSLNDLDSRKQSRPSKTKSLPTALGSNRRNFKENESGGYESAGYGTYEDIHEDSYNNDSEASPDEGDKYEKEDEYLNDEYEEDVDLGGRYNVTPAETSLLVYNRIPKCASSTMQTILRRLSRHLNFDHVSSLIYNQHQLSPDEQEKLVENLTSSITAAPSHTLSYDRHLYYTNFTGLGLNRPVYINVVRDPVERFISSFYYRRSEERLNRIQTHGRPVTPSFSWVNRTVEQCVLLNDTECSFLPGEEKEMMLSYFCGHHQFCRMVGNVDALQVAKQVVSKEYSVVGLVEHMDLSLLLMETLVPRFMDGALQVYENIRQREHMVVNVNKQKPKVSVAIRDELLRRMSDDLDFYYFLEQRLFEQKRTFLSKK